MARQLKKLPKIIMKRFKDAEGYPIAQADEDSIEVFLILLTPKGGHYRGQQHIIEFKTVYGRGADKKHFPFNPPLVKFLTKIYHPNVSDKGSICVDILTDEKKWSEAYGFNEVINSIILLLDEPNNARPYNSAAARLFESCQAAYGADGNPAHKDKYFEEFDRIASEHATTKIDQWLPHFPDSDEYKQWKGQAAAADDA